MNEYNNFPAYFLYGFFGSIILIPAIKYITREIKKFWLESRPLRKEEKKILRSFYLAREKNLEIKLNHIFAHYIDKSSELTHVLEIRYDESKLHQIEITTRLFAYISEIIRKDTLKLKEDSRKNKIENLFDDMTKIYFDEDTQF